MGQKSNPNSFQLKKSKKVLFGSSVYSGEYASLLREQKAISSNFTFLFEKNKCFVKSSYFILNNEKTFITIFISFLVWKKRKKVLTKKSNKNDLDNKNITNFVFLALSSFGYTSSKRLIVQNLNKTAVNYQKTLFLKEHTEITKNLHIFKNEPYFNAGLMLFCLMNTTKNTNLLFAKFIAKFFKIFHRTRKINKFLRFLFEFVENIFLSKSKNCRIKGLKIRIKGRFSGAPRSKVRIFEKGQIPLQTIQHKITYGLTHVHTSYGVFGVKVWLFD